MGVVFQFPWEVYLIEYLQNIITNNTFLLNVFYFFTGLGEATTIVLIIGVIYWAYDKKIGFHIALNLICAQIINSMIKNIFLRIRPYGANESIDCLKAAESDYDIYDMDKQGYSFPSGHSANISSLVSTIYLQIKNKKFLIVGLFLVVLVCISRIALGVHYPTDVLAGALVGLLSTLLLNMLKDRLSKKTLYILLCLFSSIGIIFCSSNDYYSTLGLLYGFVLANLYEEKYVKFKMTRNIFKAILRGLFGGIIFLIIIEGLKLPFNSDILEAHNLQAYLYRVFRYALATFITMGVYPHIFKYNILKLDDRL